MKIKVHMLAFDDGKIREVTIPDDEARNHDLLDLVFQYGQNDFAIGPEKNTTCSVSVGDVIETERGYFLVAMSGFATLTTEQFEQWKAMDRSERSFHEWVTGHN